MKNHQQGVTLIVVMLLLVAITVIATIAVRQSLVSLNIATNSQAEQLMLQNADAAFFNIEKEDNIIQSLSSAGMFGYIDGAANRDKEMVFCYRGVSADFFDIKRASIIEWNAPDTKPKNDTMGKKGYCQVGNKDENLFTSGRRAVMTQVAVKFSSQTEKDPFFGQIFGTDKETVKFENVKPVKVFAVSIMPTLGANAVTDAQINACLSEHMNEPTIPDGVVPVGKSADSVTTCLSSLGIPFESNVTEYIIAQDFTSEE